MTADSKSFVIDYCALTHPNREIGSVRGNEDAMLVAADVLQGAVLVAGTLSLDHPRLFAVSDGVHCSPHAERASRLLLDDLSKTFQEAPDAHPANKLSRVQERYVAHALRQSKLAGMTATLVAAEIRNEHTTIYHVGDSRAWLIRDGQAKLMTRDHTILERMIDEGEIERSQAAGLATIYDGLDRYFAALPYEQKPSHDQRQVTLHDGDVLLLASDGISVLTIEQISLQNFDQLKVAASALFQLAVGQGSDDNITLVLLRARHGLLSTAM